MKSDLYQTMQSCLHGNLVKHMPQFHHTKYAVGVMLVSGGYPASYPKGKEITGRPQHPASVSNSHPLACTQHREMTQPNANEEGVSQLRFNLLALRTAGNSSFPNTQSVFGIFAHFCLSKVKKSFRK